jgi:hypothetical protein
MIYRNGEAALPVRRRGPKEMLFSHRSEVSIADAIEQQQQLARFREELSSGVALQMEALYPGHCAGRILACGGTLAATNTQRCNNRSQPSLDALAVPGAIMMNESPEQILARLYELLGQAVLLPLVYGEKYPIGKESLGWEKITFADTQAEKYQERLLKAIARGGNIGVRLGALSDGLVAIDLDDDRIADHFLEELNPQLRLTLRSRGCRGFQLWLRIKGDYPNAQGFYNLYDSAGRKYAEWRCGGGDKGAQSVIFGLRPKDEEFPLGGRYQILNARPPLEIDFGSINWGAAVWPKPKKPDAPEPERELRPLRGASILDYAEREIDLSRVLLGDRWLSRCCGGFVVAPSGHGKSTLVIQVAILWSCGRVAFGIKPAHPLRILIVQSEDDDNDIIEMSQMCERLALTPDERALVRKNTHIEWLNDVAGATFFPVLGDFLSQFEADLLIINPYTAYQGGDIRDDELNNDFLRVHLSTVMNKYNCGVLAVHHSPKTQFQKTEDFSWHDWMYSMAGGSALTNWARAVLVIAPTDLPGTYRFIAAKRFEKIGWQEREYWFAHSVENGKVLWVPATQDQIATAKTTLRRDKPGDLLELIPPIDPLLQEKLWIKAKTNLHVGKNTARDLVNILLHDGKIFEHTIPREGAKSAKGYAKHPPVEEDV